MSQALARRVAAGERRALARAISLVENDPEEAEDLLRHLRPAHRAFVLGVTGPPGTGKSTLVSRLIGAYLAKGLRVGVIAVDPTSPVSGGALLGDRVRMSEHFGEERVFIRSMASRGWSGGLSRSTAQAILLMDAAGFDVVLLETVGIGQSDVEVVGVSHAVLVLLMPGLGDEVQMSKAGLMEVGDVYVVNKSDLEGADLMVTGLLALVRSLKGRSPAVVKVSALTGEGMDRLEAAVEKVRARFVAGDEEILLRSAKGLVLQTAKGMALDRLAAKADQRVDGLARRVLRGGLTVDEAARSLVR